MCVILVCPENIRPDSATIAACHRANPHGAGVAWREDGEVHWSKGLEPDEVEKLIAGLTGEIVIHFRIASVGEVTPKLCHPFPVTACATTRLSGHARAVLFHNGTWSDWRENLRRMPRHRMPDELLSDTRVAASLVDLCGVDVLDRLPGRWVFFDRDFTELYGDWREWDGIRVSNLGFTHQLRDTPRHQSTLKLSVTCGNPDTRKPRK
jgi:hypothetical protein